MYKRAVVILLLLSLLAGNACAAGYRPAMTLSESIADVVYHPNGTISHGTASGTLKAVNPSTTSTLSAVNLTLANGTVVFVDHIGPGTAHTMNYTVSPSSVAMPLSLKETITPLTLTRGVQQQVRLVVEVEDTGGADITGFTYVKSLPSGLIKAWEAYDGGSLTVNDTVIWTIGDLAPGERKNLSIAFNLTPAAAVNFPGARVHYDYSSAISGNAPGMTSSTDTSFRIQKAHISDGSWLVNATVPNEGEFDIALDSASIRRGDASDPFNTVELASYRPDVVLSPGDPWSASLIDHYASVPAYFLKIAYSIPYTTVRLSHVEAMTLDVNIAVTTPASGPASGAVPPYATPLPAPSATPVPHIEPDIIFIAPAPDEVITGNSTMIETSMPPSDDPGYVVYYISSNNMTWIKLGVSQVSGNLSWFRWDVPQMNGVYYLKAEHYSSDDLKGVTYTRVLIARETVPVGMTTTLISGTDWLMLFLALAALLLFLFIMIPCLRKPVIHDASALRTLSREGDWLSRLPRQTIRPDGLLVDIPGMDKIKMKPPNHIDEMRRLERDHGLSSYDAMALQLARETGATLVTADPRIAGIGKQLDVKIKLLDKVAVAVKA